MYKIRVRFDTPARMERAYGIYRGSIRWCGLRPFPSCIRGCLFRCAASTRTRAMVYGWFTQHNPAPDFVFDGSVLGKLLGGFAVSAPRRVFELTVLLNVMNHSSLFFFYNESGRFEKWNSMIDRVKFEKTNKKKGGDTLFVK